jgi:myo-inositol 2-dehydrogenase/D-chiro-inositol 1-dehydrogenase
MTVRVGVVGVGMIGQDHIRRLTQVLSGAEVVAVTDVDADRAQQVAEGLAGARVYETGVAVVQADDVDAVVVTSWGPTHEEYVLASIAAGKPVFCEKPLATTREACDRILDAELAAGRRLVMVGFMRRYDASYRAMKDTITSGAIGNPLLMHCAHRNPTVGPTVSTEGVINDTCVHEIDLVRWLFDDEIAATRYFAPRRSSLASDVLQDPLVVHLELASGVLVDVEAFVNARYGYDIRGEVVGETGTVSLADSAPVLVRRDGRFSGPVPEDWRERFIRAYDVELQDWLDAVQAGSFTGPSAWDGYAATVVTSACVEAFRTGTRVETLMREKPAFYDKTP